MARQYIHIYTDIFFENIFSIDAILLYPLEKRRCLKACSYLKMKRNTGRERERERVVEKKRGGRELFLLLSVTYERMLT